MHSNLRKHEQIEKCSKSAQNTMEAEWNIETKKHVKVFFFKDNNMTKQLCKWQKPKHA